MSCAGSGSLGPGPVLAAPSSTQATGSNPGTSMFHPCGLGRRPRTATAFTRKVGRVLRDGRQEAACACAPSLAGRGASSLPPGGHSRALHRPLCLPHRTDGETGPGMAPCPAQDHRESVPGATCLPVPQCPGAAGNSQVGPGLGAGLGSPEGREGPQGGVSARVQPCPAPAHPAFRPSTPCLSVLWQCRVP